MKLTPMRPMFRSSTVGCSCALVLVVGVNAVVRGLDDQVAVAGALAGMVLGGAVIFGSGLVFLGRWEGEHGRELLQKRAWRGTEYFFRDLHPSASHRFTRERDTVSTH